jgi:hypothetical protein
VSLVLSESFLCHFTWLLRQKPQVLELTLLLVLLLQELRRVLSQLALSWSSGC